MTLNELPIVFTINDKIITLNIQLIIENYNIKFMCVLLL